MKFILLFALFATLQACGIVSVTKNAKDLVTPFMESSEVLTAFFKHRTALYLSGKNELSLKVFIEGDGRPWVNGKNIRLDPSPHRLLMMELLLNTSGDRLYLGRPCYFQTNDERCHYQYWTSHRYSPEVINSMADVIEQKMLEGSYQKLIIIGHSGGGTIAALLACKPSITSSIITLAANLDIKRWVDIHSWSDLTGSQNPANLPSNCKRSNAYHYYGIDDENVPASSAHDFFIEGESQRFILEGVNHRNWPLFWDQIKVTLSKSSGLDL